MMKKLREWRRRRAKKSVAASIETHDVNTDGNNDSEGAPDNSFGQVQGTTNLLVDSECQTEPLNYLEMHAAEFGKTKVLQHSGDAQQGNIIDFANDDQSCLTSSSSFEASATTELQSQKLSELETVFNKANATCCQKTTCLNVLGSGVFESIIVCINNSGRHRDVKVIDINSISNHNSIVEVTEEENTLKSEKETKREVICPQDNTENSDEVVLYDLPTNNVQDLKESCAIEVQALVHENNSVQNEALDTPGASATIMTKRQDDTHDDDYDDSYRLHDLSDETSSEDDSCTYGGSIVTVRHIYSRQDMTNKTNVLDGQDIHDKVIENATHSAYEHHSRAKTENTYDYCYEEMLSHDPFNPQDMKTNRKSEEGDGYEVVGSNQNEQRTCEPMDGKVSRDSVREHVYEKIDYSKISFGNKQKNLGATMKKVVACSNSSSEEEEETTRKIVPHRSSQKSFTRDATERNSYKGACKYTVYDYGHF